MRVARLLSEIFYVEGRGIEGRRGIALYVTNWFAKFLQRQADARRRRCSREPGLGRARMLPCRDAVVASAFARSESGREQSFGFGPGLPEGGPVEREYTRRRRH